MFVIYPPHVGWGAGMKWGDLATWVSSVASFSAVAVALGLALSQMRADERKVRRIRSAIVPALIADLKVMLELMRQIHHEAELPVAPEQEAAKKERLTALSLTICLPTFERFSGLLPSLGDDLAPVVVFIYARLIRLSELLRAHVATTDTSKIAADYQVMKQGAFNQMMEIEEAMKRILAHA